MVEKEEEDKKLTSGILQD